MKYIT
jgi:cysteinyl-tRNA synthetase